MGVRIRHDGERERRALGQRRELRRRRAPELGLQLLVPVRDLGVRDGRLGRRAHGPALAEAGRAESGRADDEDGRRRAAHAERRARGGVRADARPRSVATGAVLDEELDAEADAERRAQGDDDERRQQSDASMAPVQSVTHMP